MVRWNEGQNGFDGGWKLKNSQTELCIAAGLIRLQMPSVK